MKVFLLLAFLQLVQTASLRGPSEAYSGLEDHLQALDVQLLQPGPDQGQADRQSDAVHHLDEPYAGHQTQEFTEPALEQTADGTGKLVPELARDLTIRKRPSKVYDAVINRERRSPAVQLLPEQVSLNCREVVAVGVRDPYTCAKLGQGSLPGDPSTYGVSIDKGEVIGADGKVIFADPMGAFSTDSILDLAKAPGRCRFDPHKASVDPSTACLCVATAASCTLHRDGCFWFDEKKTGKKECISNAERFYDHLYMLLHKRGKKDFAINIRYGGTPARGSLPLGPLGPQIIGQGNPNPTYSMNPDGMAPAVPAEGMPFSFGTPLAGPPLNPMLSPFGWMSPSPFPMPTEPNGGIGDGFPGFSAQRFGPPGFGPPGFGPPGFGAPGFGPPGFGPPGFAGSNTQNFGNMQSFGIPQFARSSQ